MPEGLVHPEFVVETDWVAANLDNPRVRVLDSTIHLLPRPNNVLYDVKPGYEDFEKAHIPGAGFVDIEHDAIRTPCRPPFHAAERGALRARP